MVLILALVEAPSWISAQFTNWQWRQECAVITVLSSWVLIFVRIVVRQRGRWQRWRKRKDLNLYFIKISAIINTFTWSRENRCTLTISKINKTYRRSWKPRCARRPFSSLTNKIKDVLLSNPFLLYCIERDIQVLVSLWGLSLWG